MHRSPGRTSSHELADLVVERPVPADRGRVLGDPRHLGRLPRRVVEAPGESLGQALGVLSEHRHDPAGEHGAGDLCELTGSRARPAPVRSAGRRPPVE